MKKLLIALAATTALMMSPAMAQDKKLKIGAAPYGLNAEFMQIWSAALEQHPAVKSGEIELTVFDGRYDALVQQEQFNTMITQKFDAIIFVPIDIEAGATAVQAAHDAGIPVVGSNTRVNSDLLASYVGSDDTISGYMEAKTVLDKIGCKGNVVIIEGPIGQSAQISRLEGNKKALAECPDVKVLEDQTANWSRAEAQTLMENWLTSSFRARSTASSARTTKWRSARSRRSSLPTSRSSDFAIAGIDGVTDALTAVKAGTMTSILQDASAQAQGALDLAIFQREERRLQAGIGHLEPVSGHAVQRRHGQGIQCSVDARDG